MALKCPQELISALLMTLQWFPVSWGKIRTHLAHRCFLDLTPYPVCPPLVLPRPCCKLTLLSSYLLPGVSLLLPICPSGLSLMSFSKVPPMWGTFATGFLNMALTTFHHYFFMSFLIDYKLKIQESFFMILSTAPEIMSVTKEEGTNY